MTFSINLVGVNKDKFRISENVRVRGGWRVRSKGKMTDSTRWGSLVGKTRLERGRSL